MENNPSEKVMIGYLIFTLGKARLGQLATLKHRLPEEVLQNHHVTA